MIWVLVLKAPMVYWEGKEKDEDMDKREMLEWTGVGLRALGWMSMKGVQAVLAGKEKEPCERHWSGAQYPV